MSGFFPGSAKLALVLFLLLPTACIYGLSGGGGFPSDIRTVFIAPLGDETGRFDVGQQIFTELSDELPRALGLRLAGERAADALVRGTVTRYEDAAQNYRPGEPGSVDVVQHQVQITMSIQIIDVRRSVILYEQTAVSGRGEYRPDTQSDEVARARAIETLIQQIINGAQSQW
ncbi:MAG TPA: LPS assembly lipoprotein LptE [Longimicrobiales bacterium]